MMRISNTYYLIVDLEATCSDEGSLPREEMEIIEIGAVVQHAGTFECVDEFQAFVRPLRHPRLTTFCTELTTITQEQVDSAETFPIVVAAFANWMARFDDLLFCSWGNYDRSQFQRDCDYHYVDYPFGPEHLNLKAEFSRCQNQRRQFGLDGALKRLGLQFEGTPHRGIDDVRNIARIVWQIGSGG